jgi:predicted tellurium resistance membrane protein TerC
MFTLAAAAMQMSDAPLWSLDSLLALLTLAILEIVLGIDNIVVIAIVTGRLPKEQQAKARNIGLALAMIMRILLLLAIGLIMKMTEPLVNLFGYALSGKDLVLLGCH